MIEIQNLRKGSKKRSGKRIFPTHITIHSTGNKNSTIQNERDYLENPNNTGYTGWHYVIGDNKIIQAIPPNERAWHAGDGSNGVGNNQSIGIEMIETGNRQKVIENTVWLTKQLMKEFNIPESNVVRHMHWTNTNCPRIFNYNNWQGWTEFKTMIRSDDNMKPNEVRKIAQEEIKKAEQSKRNIKIPSNWAKSEWVWAEENGYLDGTRPLDSITRQEIAVLIKRLVEGI